MADPSLNDFLDLIRPALDRKLDGLRRAVAMHASEATARGISGNLVAQGLDRCDEIFEAGADEAFNTLRRVSKTTSLEPDQLSQLTIQSLENFVLAVKAASRPETLKQIVKSSLVDDRLAALDQRLALMARQYQVGFRPIRDEIATPAFGAALNTAAFGSFAGVDARDVLGPPPTPHRLSAIEAAPPSSPPQPVLPQNQLDAVAAEQIAGLQRRNSNAAVESTAGKVEPVPPVTNTVGHPQEPTPNPRGIQPLAGAAFSAVRSQTELTLRSEPVTIAPTPYPDDPTTILVVHGAVQINTGSAEFRAFKAKLDELVGVLRQSNELASSRDQIIAEMTAGRTILEAPKPNRDLLELLLVRPLKYLADKAGAAIIGGLAAEALHLLLKLL